MRTHDNSPFRLMRTDISDWYDADGVDECLKEINAVVELQAARIVELENNAHSAKGEQHDEEENQQ